MRCHDCGGETGFLWYCRRCDSALAVGGALLLIVGACIIGWLVSL